MKLAVLFSGGKDSTFAIHHAKSQGHEISCLITVIPHSEESMLLHSPCISITSLQAVSMNIPHLTAKSNSIDVESECNILRKLIQRGIDEFQIQGIIHGGIFSEFQKRYFESLCVDKNLQIFAPVWHADERYIRTLLDANFQFILSGVSSDGLDDSWLGVKITTQNLVDLENLSKKYGFNLNFEGGEAETLVIDCPLFEYPIDIQNFTKDWNGYFGKIDISVAQLGYRA